MVLGAEEHIGRREAELFAALRSAVGDAIARVQRTARVLAHLVSGPQPESRDAGAVDMHEVQPGNRDVHSRALDLSAVAAGQEGRLTSGLREAELGPDAQHGRWRRRR